MEWNPEPMEDNTPKGRETFQCHRFTNAKGEIESWEEARWRTVRKQRRKKAGEGREEEKHKPESQEPKPEQHTLQEKETELPKKENYPNSPPLTHSFIPTPPPIPPSSQGYPLTIPDIVMEELQKQVMEMATQLNTLMGALQTHQAQPTQAAQAPPQAKREVKPFKGKQFEREEKYPLKQFLYALENQFEMQGVVEDREKILVLVSGLGGTVAT